MLGAQGGPPVQRSVAQNPAEHFAQMNGFTYGPISAYSQMNVSDPYSTMYAGHPLSPHTPTQLQATNGMHHSGYPSMGGSQIYPVVSSQGQAYTMNGTAPSMNSITPCIRSLAILCYYQTLNKKSRALARSPAGHGAAPINSEI